MQNLERSWEVVSDFFGGITSGVERGITSLFGSSNARYIKRLSAKVEAINALESKFEKLSEEELRGQTTLFRKRLAAGETLDDLLVEAFAVCREGGRRFLGMRHYDVQLIGGMILHSGAIAEMVTGEGKTLVATLPAYLNALSGDGVHVVTVNDYLARRDMEWMGPLYMGLGLTVGAIQSQMPEAERQRAYECDLTYGTNNEFGFDYLRDNMKPAAFGDDSFPKHQQQCQRKLNYAIIDEVDNILIDEARTPLIISGPAHDDIRRYVNADRIARQLQPDVHFEVKEKERSASLTDEGVRTAERLAGVESFYTAGNMEWPHLIDNALKAHYLYKRDVNYVVQDGDVIIVDDFTGRLMPGRNWSDGLHQAVQAKEGVQVKQESQTLATVTLQNFFKLYDKLAGMTGTGMTEANEFWKIYKLDVIAVPTNRELQRINYPDVIYRSEKEKFAAIADEIEAINKWDRLEVGKEELIGVIQSETDDEFVFVPKGSKQQRRIRKADVKHLQRKGRPVLVGTVSIEKSERLSDLLTKRGVKHNVLNAKHHSREAEIVAQAGRSGAVTIATNMAGRGTDIILGGNAETMAWAQLQEKYATRLDVPNDEWDALVEEIEEREAMKSDGRHVVDLGGLHIIGTERHEARRIDLQLRGRAGRQGDPGSSRFFLSLEDDLMRIFAGEWVRKILTSLGMQEGEAIESGMVSRRIEGAQKKVEERNFEIRKNLLEYDEVMDEQRKRVYGYRQRILDGEDCKQLFLDMIDEQIDRHLDEFLHRMYGAETFARWAGAALSTDLDAREYFSVDIDSAIRVAKDEAERAAETQILDAIEENLPEEEEDGWNWEALAKLCNAKWRLNLRDRDLKKIGRDHLAEHLIQVARDSINKVELEEGAKFLEEDFGRQTAIDWAKAKFGVELALDEVHELEPEQFKQLLRERAAAAYDEKEAQFAVMAGLVHCTKRDASGKRYDRDEIVAWARDRFEVDLSLEDLKNKQREEIDELLVEHSRHRREQAATVLAEAEQKVGALIASRAASGGGNGALGSLADWLKQKVGASLDEEKLNSLDDQALKRVVSTEVEKRFRPEMRKLERYLLLQLLDSAWKEHLLVMDHLRNAVGLRGYGQMDAKVEYKRDGMRLFGEMWTAMGDRATDYIFRVEQLPEEFIGSTWSGQRAVHEEAPPQSEIADQQQAAISASQQSDRKPEPIRNRDQRVGRNDPCPCGSGKKFKACCGRPGAK